jgi:hypothetical protein
MQGRRQMKIVGRGLSAVALARDAHLSDDETVAKMGHPVLWMTDGG